MKKLLWILLLVVATAQAAEVTERPDGSTVITLTADEAKQCAEEGGCILISSNALAKAVEVIVERACGREAKF